jgi:NADH:ubiquinone oxidoreductase subunit
VPWRRERRWVVFARDADPTRVPPGWVGWLHKRLEKPPSEQPLPAPSWEKERLPNLTGTEAAYLPPGALQRGGQRAPATGDYEAWRPE